jgi:hypothetical protein
MKGNAIAAAALSQLQQLQTPLLSTTAPTKQADSHIMIITMLTAVGWLVRTTWVCIYH